VDGGDVDAVEVLGLLDDVVNHDLGDRSYGSVLYVICLSILNWSKMSLQILVSRPFCAIKPKNFVKNYEFIFVCVWILSKCLAIINGLAELQDQSFIAT
jgi:hypothetical protein